MNAPDSRTRRTLVSGLLAATALSGLPACGGGDDGTQARLRVLNLATDLAAIDLYAGDERLFAAVASDQVSGYVGLKGDSYTLRVRRAGEATALLSASQSLSRRKHYTALVWGRENALRLSLLDEDAEDDDIDRGSTRLRLLNAAPDAGTLDVFLTASGTDIGDAVPTQSELAAGALGGYGDLSSGPYRLRVTGAGDPGDLRLDAPLITLPGQRHATLVLTAGSGGVLVNASLLSQRDALTTLKNDKARLRLVASVDDAALVGASLDGRTLSSGLRSPSIGPYVLIDAGAGQLDLRVDGRSLGASAQRFTAGNDYTVLALGRPDQPLWRLLDDDNRVPANPGRLKMRLVHGVAGTEAVTLSVDFLALVADLPVGRASAYATLGPSTAARVDVGTAAATQPLFVDTEAQLQAGSVYSVFLLGGNAQPAGAIRKER